MSRSAIVGLSALALLGGGGCDPPPKIDLSTPAPATLGFAATRSAVPMASVDAGLAGDHKQAPAVEEKPSPIEPQLPVIPSADDPAGSIANGFIIDTLVDVAAAGPAAATGVGVVMINRRNHLHLARLSKRLRSASPGKTPLASLSESAGPFPLARAPAVRAGIAYWVSRGRLLQQEVKFAGSEREPKVLTTDARVGTRVAVPQVSQGEAAQIRRLPPMVAYIARAPQKGGALSAKLWSQGKTAPLQLTEEAASATSVSLLATPKGVAAISLEGRTGMSSLHLRLLSRGKKRSDPFQLGVDRVVWVGGASGVLSEFVPHSLEGSELQGWMATSRDMTHFGLLDLRIDVGEGARAKPTSVHWMNYLNGIDPAPVASISVCGRSMLLIAQPGERQAHASQRLLWIERRAQDASLGIVLARGRSFFDVSVAAISGGALITYVADHRTWARTIRCGS